MKWQAFISEAPIPDPGHTDNCPAIFNKGALREKIKWTL